MTSIPAPGSRAPYPYLSFLPGHEPGLVREQTRNLLALYAQAEAALNAQWARIVDDPNGARARARVTELLDSLERSRANVDIAVQQFMRTTYPAYYQGGAVNMAEKYHGATPFQWSQPHRAAVGLLAADTYAGLLRATEYTPADIKQKVRELARQTATEKLLGGQTATQAGKSLGEKLAAQGISNVTYADGKQVSSTSYANMVMRTQTAVAYNAGGINQAVADAVEVFEISDGPECGLAFHDDDQIADGMIVDADTASQYPISHPNCVRDFIPRPDVSAADLANPDSPPESLVAPIQAEDQLAFDEFLRQEGETNGLTLEQAANKFRRIERTGRTPISEPRAGRTPREARNAPEPPIAEPQVPTELGLPPITDPAARGSAIDQLMKQELNAGHDTETLFDKLGDAHDVYTPERAAMQDQIIEAELAKAIAGGAEKGNTGIILSGLPGAGKSAGYGQIVDSAKVIQISPDNMKEAIVRAGGLNPPAGVGMMEGSPLLHEESSMLAKRLATRATDEGYNVVWDITGASEEKVQVRIDSLRAAGYKVTGVYVDAPIEQALRQSESRYARGLARDPEFARFTPPENITKSVDPSGRFDSNNRAVFEVKKGNFDEWILIDNTGTAPVIADTSNGALINGKIELAPPGPTVFPGNEIPAAEIYYHGTGIGGGRLTIDTPAWDKNTFITDVQSVAQHYADRHPNGRVITARLAPGVRVFEPDLPPAEYTPEKLVAILNQAIADGYGAVHFIGGKETVVLDRTFVTLDFENLST